MVCGRKASPGQIVAAKATAGSSSGGPRFKSTRRGGVLHIHFKEPGSSMFLPWVTVKSSPLGGKGVFAAREFKKGDRIGTYFGKVLGRTRDEETEARVEASRSTMIININGVTVDGGQPPQSEAAQQALIGRVMYPAGNEWPGMHAHVVNSAFNMQTQRLQPSLQNCAVKYGGSLRATKHIHIGQELLQNYGREYHVSMK